LSVTVMTREVVGRQSELRSIYTFLDAPRETPAGLVLEGEPGIGKSTLWLAAVAAARERGFLVLVSRPAEAERAFVHVGLGDLFDGILDDVIGELSPPRRRALEVALLRNQKANDGADHRALAVAVHDTLGLLSERKSVVVAIDDVQWLDPSSASALAFALRRLDAAVLLIFARRLEPSDLEQAVDVERLSIGPLSVGALHRLLHDRLGRQFARQTLVRLHEESGGNPFFALELARVLHKDVDLLEPLPVPATLEELVRTRLAGLPPTTRDALALAAALGTPSESLLERAGAVPGALAPAIAARVVERERRTIRFTHPLLSSVLYNDLGARRRIVHERIAAIVPDPVTRARHLALATDEPDPTVAAALDDAATIAAGRGALASAAQLVEAALRLTPAHEVGARHRRALAAARAHRASGEWTRARTIAYELLEDSRLGSLRADVLLLLAEVESLDRAVALLEDALHEARSHPALLATIQCRLALSERFAKGFDVALDHARESLELANEVDDDALRVNALVVMTFLGSAVGDPMVTAYAARAYEIAVATGDARLVRRARLSMVDVTWRTDQGVARALLEREYEESHERDDLSAAEALDRFAWLELWAGRWELAAEYAERSYDLMTQYGLEVPWVHLPIAVVAAHRGRLELAREHSERSLKLGEEQFGRHTPVHLGTLGFVALQSGDPPTAVRWFAEAEAVTTKLGWRDAGRRWWVGDHVEALLALDRIDDAVRVLGGWEAESKAGDDRTRAHLMRCRGLVAAAQGAVEDAASLLGEAVAQHENVGDRFGQGRALLALGSVRRRQRRKRAAREAIATALAGFEQLGAATWIEKAHAELGRIGGRTRTVGLTPAERRVAALVAEGSTNKEVAAALFLGERTVETHLTHVYAKLGVRSRVELARLYRPDSASVEQSSGERTISS
jgi:DNA-binding CsgD family transcriptional regulator